MLRIQKSVVFEQRTILISEGDSKDDKLGRLKLLEKLAHKDSGKPISKEEAEAVCSHIFNIAQCLAKNFQCPIRVDVLMQTLQLTDSRWRMKSIANQGSMYRVCVPLIGTGTRFIDAESLHPFSNRLDEAWKQSHTKFHSLVEAFANPSYIREPIVGREGVVLSLQEQSVLKSTVHQIPPLEDCGRMVLLIEFCRLFRVGDINNIMEKEAEGNDEIVSQDLDPFFLQLSRNREHSIWACCFGRSL